MNSMQTLGKVLVVVGSALVLLGGLVWVLGKAGLLGRLPGDIRIERPGFTCLIPLASSIILSILLSIALTIIVRLINR